MHDRSEKISIIADMIEKRIAENEGASTILDNAIEHSTSVHSTAEHAALKCTMKSNYDFQSLEKEIRDINESWEVDLPRSVASNKRYIGKLASLVKRVSRKLMFWYVCPPFQKQKMFNASLTRSLNGLFHYARSCQGEITDLRNDFKIMLEKVNRIETVVNKELGQTKALNEQFGQDLQCFASMVEKNENGCDQILEKVNKLESFIISEMNEVKKSGELLAQDHENYNSRLNCIETVEINSVKRETEKHGQELLNVYELIRKNENELINANYRISQSVSEMQNVKDNVTQSTDRILQEKQNIEKYYDSQISHVRDLINANTSSIEYYRNMLQNTVKNEDMEFIKQKLLLMDENLKYNLNSLMAGKSSNNESDIININYLDFENHFRGSEDNITAKMEFYTNNFKDGDLVLDIGCGRGEFLNILFKKNISGIGIDVDLDMIKICRDKGLNVYMIDAIDYLSSIPDNYFNGIIMTQVIEHLEPNYLIRLLELAYRKLKKGGRIIMETQNPMCLFIYAYSFYVDLSHKKPIHPYTLKYLVESKGFKNTEIKLLSQVQDDMQLEMLESSSDNENNNQINNNFQKLNRLLYGYQDYAVITEKLAEEM